MSIERPIMPALWHGLHRNCPRCGQHTLFSGYLAVEPGCRVCGLDFSLYRADDAPPYFTIFIVGHIIITGMLMLEEWAAPPVWVHLVIWLPLTIILTGALLPYIKGAVLGAQWALDIKTGAV